jgi:hypothetical protein
MGKHGALVKFRQVNHWNFPYWNRLTETEYYTICEETVEVKEN